MLRYESEIWRLQRILRAIGMLIYASRDMDFTEDPEIYMDGETCSRRRGSCRDDMRYKDAET